MVRVGCIEVHRLLDEPLAERSGVEVEIWLRRTADRRHVVDAGYRARHGFVLPDLRIENAAGRAPRLFLPFGKRNELLRVTPDGVEAPARPFFFGLLDPLRPRGDEVPPYVTRSSHRGAAEQHETGVRRGLDDDLIAGSEHEELTRPERGPRHIDLSGDRIERALFIGRLDRELRAGSKLHIRVERLRGGLQR